MNKYQSKKLLYIICNLLFINLVINSMGFTQQLNKVAGNRQLNSKKWSKMRTLNSIFLIILLPFVLLNCLNRKEYNGIGFAGEPAWGSNNQIAFIYTPFKIINNDTIWIEDSSGLWIIESDGSKMQLLKVGNYDEPYWSSDCQWIACSDLIGKLWRINIKNKTANQIFVPIRAWCPNFTPDGQKIIFATPDSSQFGQGGIYKITLGDSIPRLIFPYGSKPNVSPDDTMLVFLGWIWMNNEWMGGIIVSDSIGNNARIILYLEQQYADNPTFSPDRSKICFDTGGADPEVWIINSDGNGLRKIIENGRMPVFSPDGEKIVYQRWSFLWGLSDQGKLWIVNIDGSNNHQLTF